jgi:hypothetical protein
MGKNTVDISLLFVFAAVVDTTALKLAFPRLIADRQLLLKS